MSLGDGEFVAQLDALAAGLLRRVDRYREAGETALTVVTSDAADAVMLLLDTLSLASGAGGGEAEAA